MITGLPPARVRAAHAAKLKARDAHDRIAAREIGIAAGEPGFYLQFHIPVTERGAVEGLESKRNAIELVAVRPTKEGDELILATVDADSAVV